MSMKFFRTDQDFFKFDPESAKSFVYRAGQWQELVEPAGIEELRFRTVELSLSEAVRACGAGAV